MTSRYKIDVSSRSTPLSIFSQTSDAFSDPYILRLLPCQVYDVSTYLDEHPGGDDVIIAATGTYSYAL